MPLGGGVRNKGSPNQLTLPRFPARLDYGLSNFIGLWHIHKEIRGKSTSTESDHDRLDGVHTRKPIHTEVMK